MLMITPQQRQVIYRARRGLKELDVFFSPYAKYDYLDAPASEQAAFAALVEQEDPDLLDWFMQVKPVPVEFAALIERMRLSRQREESKG